MKKGFFIVSDTNLLSAQMTLSDGIAKKILSQVDSLNIDEEMSCKLVNLPIIRTRNIFSLFLGNKYRKLSFSKEKIDFFYIRRIIPLNNSFFKLLKRIKNENPYCRIVFEIPTYPYDKEYNTFMRKIALFFDRYFRKKLKKYIDKIVTFSNDTCVFGVHAIRIINGIKCSDVPVRIPEGENSSDVHFIAIAIFSFWHGYDRLIQGLHDYYSKGKKQNIYIHFVGDGPELKKYKQLVHDYNLHANVFFYKLLSGGDLSKVFNKVDIAFCSLANHRGGIFLSSELKSREYLARGIPFVSSAKIDVLPADFPYCLYIPEDESPVDIEKVIAFLSNILANNACCNIIDDIRKFAEENCDMSVTMRPVIEYLSSY